VCIDIAYSTKGQAYWAELGTGAKKTLDRYKPGRDYLAP
jgi:hypothetical protein